MGLKEKFLRIYVDLPLPLRKEVILILDKEPITWNVVYIEVSNKTEKADKILKRLEGLKIM